MNNRATIRSAFGAATIAALMLLSACTSPVVYRPEVESFQLATNEMSGFIGAKRATVTAIREDLRRSALTRLADSADRPDFGLSGECSRSLQDLAGVSGGNAGTIDPSVCDLVVSTAGNAAALAPLRPLINPEEALDDSAAFAAAVASYAAALGKVTTAGDRESFVVAVNDLAATAGTVATSAAKAAGEPPPALDALTPIASLVGQAVSLYLEHRRAEALIRAATEAQPWMERGASAVADTVGSAQFEIVRVRRAELLARIDAANEAPATGFVDATDAVIAAGTALRRALAADPGAPFRALPAAHAKLIEAFDDRSRHLAGAIAASKALFDAARDARDALSKDR